MGTGLPRGRGGGSEGAEGGCWPPVPSRSPPPPGCSVVSVPRTRCVLSPSPGCIRPPSRSGGSVGLGGCLRQKQNGLKLEWCGATGRQKQSPSTNQQVL